jgi:hypothetical protein
MTDAVAELDLGNLQNNSSEKNTIGRSKYGRKFYRFKYIEPSYGYI